MVKNLSVIQETGFNPWVGKIPRRWKWHPTAAFLSGEFHGQRSLAGYSPWCGKESDTPVQFSSVARLCPTLRPCPLQHARPPYPSPTPRACSNSCPSLQWCHPTISSSVVPFPSSLQSFVSSGAFSNEAVLHIRWPKYWSFTFSISPSNEQSGLVSFRIVRFDLFAVQIQVLFNLTWTTAMASVLRSQIHSLGFHEKWKIQFLQLSFLMLPHCLWAQILSHFIWPCLYFFSHAFYNFPLHITGLSCLLVVYLLSFTFHELCCFS